MIQLKITPRKTALTPYNSCAFSKKVRLLFIFIPVILDGMFTLHSSDIINE